MEPIEQTSRIYDFIGMKISPEIEEFLKKSTTTQDLESNHRSDQKFMQIYTTSVSYLSVFLTVKTTQESYYDSLDRYKLFQITRQFNNSYVSFVTKLLFLFIGSF